MKALLRAVMGTPDLRFPEMQTGTPYKFDYLAGGLSTFRVYYREHSFGLELRHVVAGNSWGKGSNRDPSSLVNSPFFLSRREIKRVLDRFVMSRGLLVSVGGSTHLDMSSLNLSEQKKLAAFEPTDRLRGFHLHENTQFGNFLIESIDSQASACVSLTNDAEFVIG